MRQDLQGGAGGQGRGEEDQLRAWEVCGGVWLRRDVSGADIFVFSLKISNF